MTWAEVAWGLLTMALSWIGAWTLAKSSGRAKRASDAHVQAVDRLLPAMAQLRALVHESTATPPTPNAVSLAVYAFEEVCMQHAAALPRELSSLQRDVRAAIGNYFGSSALAAIDAEMRGYPLSKPDPYWQDISATYLEYAMRHLQQSLVTAKVTKLVHFAQWRREEDPHHRTQN
ncbi:hypothetical protein [Knoellia flava]|uniref:Uncharacterized protein n=1 Tax=Knoellia flava TaxID=913969 RepID=A0A8H9KUH0_9MICO|nr:hypothetical protein [Knoellia flava]GGB81489.1 hypothetical protein GCM10011314_21370 [Knoellia flava]